MDTTHEELTNSSSGMPIEESLPPLVARQIESVSREHVSTQPRNMLEQYRRGRVEAEAHRISDEVTHEAQERLQLSAIQVQSQQSEDEVSEIEKEGSGESVAIPVSSFNGEQTVPPPKLLKRLLVPLDGTPEGERTLPYASALAKLLHAHLTLSHVTPTTDANGMTRALHIAGSDRQAAQQALAPQVLPYLRDLRWRLTTPLDQVDTLHISAPSVLDGLLELAATNNTDLVILGLRPHHSTDHLGLGKVVDSLICKGITPLLVIPPDATTESHLFMLRHILIPLDTSALAEEALAPLLGLLAQTQSEVGAPLAVTLLSVVKNPTKLPECQSYLDALRVVLMAMPECARVQLFAEAVVGSAPGAIVGMIERGAGGRGVSSANETAAGPVDLLIMATHGRGGIGRLAFGSVAGYVLPRVQIPVLLVHPVYLNI
jgi:nucleotide-binding universal stress UspA family protein